MADQYDKDFKDLKTKFEAANNENSKLDRDLNHKLKEIKNIERKLSDLELSAQTKDIEISTLNKLNNDVIFFLF
jgi:predicted RNase H-like nuclease (RuvC/YqgF family)